MKRCTKEERDKKSVDKTQLCSSVEAERSWADLDSDVLGEIKKKLYYGDYVRFGGVCKSWLAAQHDKRATANDVWPWVMFVSHIHGGLTYNLYQPLHPHQPIISRIIDLNPFFDASRLQTSPISIHYRDGCLFLSMSNMDYASTHFLVVSVPTHVAFTLPPFNHPQGFPIDSDLNVFKAVSTYPFYSDCVFLALLVANHEHWSIGIFRHGDAQWTTTHFRVPQYPACPCLKDVVFIRGVFYFLCTNQQLVSYDMASQELKADCFLTPNIYHIEKFFGLDGELMLMYYDCQVSKYFLSSYDRSQKRWVPLKSLGDRSLFLNQHSVYVGDINCHGASPNMIYLQKDDDCFVYSFENGELKNSSSVCRYWSGRDFFSECSMWVAPPDRLPI